MTATDTTVIHHYYGTTWYQVVAIALLMLAVWELGWWAGRHLADWWHDWREEHGSTQVEDAAEDGPCGECGGTGACRHCDGHGENHPLLGDWCHRCNGTGRCWTCNHPGWMPVDAPTRDEAATRVAERSET